MAEEKTPFVLARNSVSADELLTMKQIAAMLDISYWMVRALACGAEKTRVPFPQAYTKLARSPLWKRHTIEEWEALRKNKMCR